MKTHVKPNDTFNRFSSISWSTVSNAALTSKRGKSVSWEESMAAYTLERRWRSSV